MFDYYMMVPQLAMDYLPAPGVQHQIQGILLEYGRYPLYHHCAHKKIPSLLAAALKHPFLCSESLNVAAFAIYFLMPSLPA